MRRLVAAAIAGAAAVSIAACGSSGPSIACKKAVAANNAYVNKVVAGQQFPSVDQIFRLGSLHNRIAQLCPSGTRYENARVGLVWPG